MNPSMYERLREGGEPPEDYHKRSQQSVRRVAPFNLKRRLPPPQTSTSVKTSRQCITQLENTSIDLQNVSNPQLPYIKIVLKNTWNTCFFRLKNDLDSTNRDVTPLKLYPHFLKQTTWKLCAIPFAVVEGLSKINPYQMKNPKFKCRCGTVMGTKRSLHFRNESGIIGIIAPEARRVEYPRLQHRAHSWSVAGTLDFRIHRLYCPVLTVLEAGVDVTKDGYSRKTATNTGHKYGQARACFP